MKKKSLVQFGLPLAISLMSCCMASAQAPSPEPFYFAQITDAHFGVNNNQERVKKVVKAINAAPFDFLFVANTGDITSEKFEDESVISTAVDVLSEIKYPLFHVPGNHDIVYNRKGVIQGTHDTMAAIYKEHFGDFLVEKEFNGVVCLFVYTEPLAKGFVFSEFDPLKELEKSLIRADGKPVLVFHHTPCVPDFYANKMHRGWNEETRNQWIQLLNAYNVKGVFAGHFHRDEMHWLGEVPLFVSASTGDTSGRLRQTTYRIYEYRDGKISYRTQYFK